MTNQQIAEKSGVPESTVARIFSGKTPNPTIVTVISIVRAMGGTVDDLFDDTIKMNLEHRLTEEPQIIEETPSVSPDSNAANNTPGNSPSKEFFDQYYTHMISMYQTAIRKKDLWIKRLFWICLFFILVIVAILLIDVLNPTIGFFRY